MKRNMMIYVTLALAMLVSVWSVAPQPAQAQQSDLDSLLAEAAGKGFLTTLVRPELTATRDFYLLESVNITGIIAELGQVAGFAIINGRWVNDQTYQTDAVLQPGNRTITVFSGKYDNRWRVEGVELAAPATVSGGSAATTTVSAGITPVSGNGSGVLVFQTQSGGDFYRINADGTGLQRISHGIDPQLSPDGSQVTFTRWEPYYELFTVNIDGTNERSWAKFWRQMKSPTWSADGSALTVSYQDGGRLTAEQRQENLIAAALDDDAISIPSNAVGIDIDGGTLNYVIPADAHWHLRRVDLNSGQIIDLATERHSYGPSGHPAQANLVAYKGVGGIAINNVDTNTDQSVTTDHRDHTPVISPDGSRVAVSYWQDGHWEVHTMNLDGSNRQRLTTTPLSIIARQGGTELAEVQGAQRLIARENPWWNHAAPTWSPDGSQLAFLTDRTGQWEIWIMNVDGSDQRPMFSNGALAGIDLNYAGVDERMLSWR